MIRFPLLLLALLFVVEQADARPRNRGTPVRTTTTTQSSQSYSSSAGVTTSAFSSTSVTTTESGAVDALDEVNAARAKRGLRPFLRDPLLTQGAMTAAVRRAAGRIAGHLSNDFACLPAGSSARAAGCGALEPSWGWGSCCTYENHTYAGAALVMGRDGRRYMHIFVR